MALEELQDGRYRLVRSLGSGGMGEVYLMQDMRINRQVAIKVMRSEGAPYPDSTAAQEAARLFQREARAIAALEHPNILPLYDFGEEIRDGTTITYMVMPFCTEGSLASWLRQRSSAAMLSLQDFAHLVEEAADALQYAHDHDVIHLDVKASNFLLRSNKKNPNRPTLLLADFGIARSSVTIASSSRTIRGTPTSMAPEQWSSNPVPATDQYALAVMTYEMLVGRPPFVGSMEQVMYQHFSAQPPPPSAFNPQLSTAIDSVILRALVKKPEDRFPSIADFTAAFEQAVQASPNLLVVGPRQSSASDIRATLAISQVEARSGTSRVITLPGGQLVNVIIPAGVSDGHIIRLQDQGGAAPVLLTIAIKQSEDSRRLSDVSSAEKLPATLDSNAQQPFDSVSDHDFPTLPSSDPHLQSPVLQPIASVPGSRPSSRSRMTGILSGLIILSILLLLAGGGYFFYYSHQANVRSSALTQTATAGKLLTPTHASSVTVTVTATQQNGLYIAGTYNGSMTDQTTQQTTQISVFLVQTQGNAALSGTFTFSSPSSGSDPLSGTVDMQGNFAFTVQQPAGQLPLYFHGQVYQSDYLKGNFCSSNTNSCSTDTGYFTVGPKF
ncbi:MAG TPA: protein kinase [Ktedonobacteraceae bacterium]